MMSLVTIIGFFRCHVVIIIIIIIIVMIMIFFYRCQIALNEFMEQKRDAFPRFYFIGDDDDDDHDDDDDDDVHGEKEGDAFRCLLHR